jgi:hypothetical protein
LFEVIRAVRAANIETFLIAYSADELGLAAADETGADATSSRRAISRT